MKGIETRNLGLRYHSRFFFFGWVISHNVWVVPIYMNASCHTFEWVMTHSNVWHDSFICMSRAYTCRRTHARVTSLHVTDECYRVAKTHRPLIFIGHFPQKSPIFSGSCWKWSALRGSYESSPPCRTQIMCGTYESDMTHIRRSHATHLNMSRLCMWQTGVSTQVVCHTFEWVMSHIWMSHVTHLNESRLYFSNTSVSTHVVCGAHEWVMMHLWISHITYFEGWRQYVSTASASTQVISHTWMSHVTHKYESWHT